MKRRFLAALAVISLTGGCITPRNNDRPGLLRGMYNRIHRNDVGAPCASGGCMPATIAAPPLAAPAIGPGCNGCGEGVSNFPGYAVDDGFRGANFGSPAYGTELYGGDIYGDSMIPPGAIPGEIRISPNATVPPGAVYEGNGT